MLALAVTLALTTTRTVAAQGDLIRSSQPWRTVHTRHFDVHFVAEAEAWVVDLAPRLDAIHDSVAALVGYAPHRRVTIIVDDPYNISNGMALPLLDKPAVVLWATPPGPTDVIGNHRGWSIKLAAHEFAHVAHLARPARRSEWLLRLVPVPVASIAARTPRWATEGYATWVEGKITGSGRPHGVWRPAILRELALEGRLPSYGAMSGMGGYRGGNMAYLAGSAFWDWLAAQRGDTSMTSVFRRQTARVNRSFDEAFQGVYGDSPAALYARFTAALTVRAAAVDSLLSRSGIVTGTRLARFPGAVGALAASADGARIALALPGQRGGPPRVIVTAPDTQTVTDDERRRIESVQARDPEDVPAIRLIPRLARPVATLAARRGRTFGNPRFMDARGTMVLLESWSYRADGARRPDLATWNVATGAVRYVTDGADVQDADPAPDGAQAAAVRCRGGVCDLVLVALADARVRTLVAGTPTRTVAHPRWSPDGRRVAIALQERDGLWRLAVVDAASGAFTVVSPDDGIDRHTPTFDASGTALLHVTEADGILNAASLSLADGASTMRTRVVGSVYEPVPLPDGGFVFLHEHARGMDLHRMPPNVPVRGEGVGAAALALVPVMPVPRTAGVALPPSAVAAPADYGVGPRSTRLLVQGAHARDGHTVSATVSNVDPANRLALAASALWGAKGGWRGGVATAAWYGARPNIRAEALWLEQPATEQLAASRTGAFDLRIAGASVAADLPVSGSNAGRRVLVSAFAGRAQRADGPVQPRAIASLLAAGTAVIGWQTSVGASVRVAAGRSADSSVTRGSAGLFATVRQTRVDVRMHRTSRSTPLLERFAAGGLAAPLTDEATLAQRIAIPALPTAALVHRELVELRVSRPSPILGGTLYAHSVGTDWQVQRHSTVVGLEQAFAFDHLGVVGLPRFRVLGGIGQVVRGPLRNHTSLYLSAGWRP